MLSTAYLKITNPGGGAYYFQHSKKRAYKRGPLN